MPGTRVLDVGSGSGYLCAAMLEMMDRKGKVVGVEHIEPLIEQSIKNLQKSYADKLKDESIVMVYADGRKGYPKYAPYNAIHVGAGKFFLIHFLSFGRITIRLARLIGSWGQNDNSCWSSLFTEHYDGGERCTRKPSQKGPNWG